MKVDKNKLILFNPVSLKYREINKISYESKMSKIFELSFFIFMHLNRNLNTVLVLRSHSCQLWKRILQVFTKISLFLLLSAWRKERKKRSGT